MQGEMLWFNMEKGHGYLHTEDDERLYVDLAGFLPNHQPERKCKGRSVSFERETGGAEPRAVNVSFVEHSDPRRARLRGARGGHRL
jgi:cold shock CspA family protein